MNSDHISEVCSNRSPGPRESVDSALRNAAFAKNADPNAIDRDVLKGTLHQNAPSRERLTKDQELSSLVTAMRLGRDPTIRVVLRRDSVCTALFGKKSEENECSPADAPDGHKCSFKRKAENQHPGCCEVSHKNTKNNATKHIKTRNKTLQKRCRPYPFSYSVTLGRFRA